ncbi:replicative DNA helicase [Clostridium sp. D2Q-11]|uniref:Replicative DNA helicase n=1 Tax=Anaeromonas frigoriresistens TaxID=2683708 RepID=A0A942UWM9_9FIRM|nr:replicative DNA helicase [Anaeromonas frigoriresistens]MBS4536967.1 replicative DNA helicase [Anaeromonas frigoriresistens]
MEENIQKLGNIPPHSLEAEQSVLGAIILDKDAIISATEILRPEDFYKEANGEIYESVLEIYNRNEPVDLITLSEELRKRDTFEAVGGIGYLTDLSDGVSTTANIKSYCEIVEEKSLLRRLIKASNEIISEGYKDDKEIENIIDLAEKRIFEITQRKSHEGFTPMKTALMETLSKIEEMSKSGGGLTGITTGFIDLDNKTGGLQKANLILVAARPSMGKTAFSVNVAQNSAMKGESTVAIFSLEMSKGQLVQRMLSSEAHIEIQKVISGDLTEDEWVRLSKAMGPLAQAKIYIDDTPAISLAEMKAKCRKLKIEQGLDLVMIDYIQLMSGDGRTENRQQEISKISRGLKEMARELDISVIALSQLSRAPELRSDHRPIMSDLRESGAIEQDADVVMMLYRDEYYHPDTEKKNIGEVIITKQRNGPTGTVELVWMGQFTKFLNMEKFRE